MLQIVVNICKNVEMARVKLMLKWCDQRPLWKRRRRVAAPNGQSTRKLTIPLETSTDGSFRDDEDFNKISLLLKHYHRQKFGFFQSLKTRAFLRETSNLFESYRTKCESYKIYIRFCLAQLQIFSLISMLILTLNRYFEC